MTCTIGKNCTKQIDKVHMLLDLERGEKKSFHNSLVFVFSQLNIARKVALVGWMKARTFFFFFPFFIIFVCAKLFDWGL